MTTAGEGSAASPPYDHACCFTTVPGREHNINCPQEGSVTDTDTMSVEDALALRDAAYQSGRLDGAEEVRQVVRNALGLTE